MGKNLDYSPKDLKKWIKLVHINVNKSIGEEELKNKRKDKDVSIKNLNKIGK